MGAKLITYFESELELAKLPTTTAEISIPNCVSNLGRQDFKFVNCRGQLQCERRIQRGKIPSRRRREALLLTYFRNILFN